MIDPKKEIESVFGCAELPHGLFYEFEMALRFELGGEDVSTDRSIKRFIQAFERADAVAADLFAQSSVWLVSSTFGGASPPKEHLKPYETIGLSRSDFIDLGAVAQKDDDNIEEFGSDLYRHWAAVSLAGPDLVREVLWLALGSELGIRPAVSASLYFVDFDNQIALHPYDDRGLDVITMRREALLDLYWSRHSWLLDFDMPRMKVAFEET
ncbi:DUF3885 domain-containing protein [Ruegeria halocynthiae]|uniref:DUF3885 domain-containing protein n=1 Tax=Ruegeria halocynthiae TaxID=985054 RepID=UPI00068C4E78|nr:DUF3885 domain-containing protein [Ruegeria halocynthiae]